MKILIFGGTFEAVKIANMLHERGHDVTTSLAGRTDEPRRPSGKVVSGGMGGADGISTYLEKHKIDYLIDATHPFAGGISDNVYAAANKTKIAYTHFVRPPFSEPAGSGWWRVENEEQAAQRLPIGSKAFLTLGRQTIEPFLERSDAHFVLRAIEKPALELPDNFSVVLARPPFTHQQEAKLMRHERITHLIAKDSGGEMTSAKLHAAFMLSIQVIMINRPPQIKAPSVHSVEDVLAQFDHLPAPKPSFLRRFFLP